ncbi:hypothetical Protein YC6258_01145 [Gynuella sunshinyii YC6258]|uniref:Uncharacterized protein n=1 Tax=Gynuella sunshinyii YC6258 TaxID=1445510 RepID=A0A0C5VF67_9GAMM|nr:hypothetical Protein YC6258_01145 [Gynuella sunshinyii YC6258]
MDIILSFCEFAGQMTYRPKNVRPVRMHQHKLKANAGNH